MESSWHTKKSTYPRKYALCVIAHSTGVKNGNSIGKELFIAVSHVKKNGNKRSNKEAPPHPR
jgi:hypothetical protein